MVELVLFSLATWRLASLFVREVGPFKMFVRVRALVGIQHDPMGIPYGYPDNLLAGILSCTWCSSIWIALFWVLFWLITPLTATKIATVFALSAGAILIDKWMGN